VGQVHHNDEQREIERWRRQRLQRAGFERELAAELAGEPAVDLHDLLSLLARGCPPELAARILAPIDHPGAAR